MKSFIKLFALSILLAAFLAACGGSKSAGKTFAQADVLSAFEKGACGTCHTIPGVPNAKGVLGPELGNIRSLARGHYSDSAYTGSAKPPEEFIRESVVNPDVYVSNACPTGPCPAGVMPASFSKTLNEEEIGAIVSYLNNLPEGAFSGSTDTAAAASPRGPSTTSMALGRCSRRTSTASPMRPADMTA